MKPRNMLARTAVGLTVLAAWAEAGLVQKYCSSQNTGANNGPVFGTWMSNGACMTQCQDTYALAIVQGNYCWCSNYIPSSQFDVSACSDTCPGFPSELCGNVANALYGFVALTKQPLGTAGLLATSSTSTTPSAPPQTNTVSVVVVQTVTQDQAATTVVSYVTPTPSTSSTSTTSPSTSTSSSISTTSTPSTTSSSSTIVLSLSAQVVTLAGQVVTQTVTTTPFVASGQDAGSLQQVQDNSGISGGAIAGIVIGVLVALAIFALAGVLLWRHKRRQNDQTGAAAGAATSEKAPVKRNTSVLSRSGLLGGGGAHHNDGNAESNNPFDEPHNGTVSQRHSMLFGAGAVAAEPTSPLGSSASGNSRRHSKPMVYDQRLNPSALFTAHDNGSRVSMQDGADYSRTLGVTNPDPRSSWESRISR